MGCGASAPSGGPPQSDSRPENEPRPGEIKDYLEIDEETWNDLSAFLAGLLAPSRPARDVRPSLTATDAHFAARASAVESEKAAAVGALKSAMRRPSYAYISKSHRAVRLEMRASDERTPGVRIRLFAT